MHRYALAKALEIHAYEYYTFFLLILIFFPAALLLPTHTFTVMYIFLFFFCISFNFFCIFSIQQLCEIALFEMPPAKVSTGTS